MREFIVDGEVYVVQRQWTGDGKFTRGTGKWVWRYKHKAETVWHDARQDFRNPRLRANFREELQTAVAEYASELIAMYEEPPC